MKVHRVKKAQDEPETEKPTDKELETLLLQVVEQNAAILAHTFVFGIALILLKADITKDELGNLKPSVVVNKLRDLLRSIVAERQSLVQEFRLLWRYGPERYAQRKIKDFKGAI